MRRHGHMLLRTTTMACCSGCWKTACRTIRRRQSNGASSFTPSPTMTAGTRGAPAPASVTWNRSSPRCTGTLPLERTSCVPSITHVPPTLEDKSPSAQPKPAAVDSVEPAVVGEPGSTDALHDEAGARDSWLLLLFSGAGLVALTWGVVQVFNRWVYLVGITQPLWACGSMVRNAGQNVLVLCDKETKAEQLDGMTLLDLESIVKESDFKRAWRKALFELDEKSRDGSVLIADFDEELDNALGMERKLLLLEELVFDQSRRVVVLSRVSLRGLTDAVRHAAGASAAAPDAKEAMLDRWRRIVKALVIVERRQKEPPCEPHEQRSPAVTFLLAERESHPEVRRVCDDLLKVDGAEKRLTRAQAFDELWSARRSSTADCGCRAPRTKKSCSGTLPGTDSPTRRCAASCASCSVAVSCRPIRVPPHERDVPPLHSHARVLAASRGARERERAKRMGFGCASHSAWRCSAWVFFSLPRRRSSDNAIFGFVTAAAASVPTLIQTVGKLVGRPIDGPGLKA